MLIFIETQILLGHKLGLASPKILAPIRPWGSMTYAFTHMRNFLLLLLLVAWGMTKLGRNWQNFNRIWQKFAEFGRIWRNMMGFGRFWQNMVVFGRIWPNLAKYGGIWQNLAEFGRIWQNWAEFGRIWQGDGEGGTGRPRAIRGQRYPLPCFAWL